MDANKKQIIEQRIAKTIENLQKNNMQAFYVQNCEEAVHCVQSLLHQGDRVTTGGSVTLDESGIMDLLRSGDYCFMDRYAPGLTKEQINQIFVQAFSADAYLCSANAITENGELYNVDGNCNRVAAILFGPKSVIVVAGYNKIVKNIAEAADRVKTMAAPANALRLHCDTYCAHSGKCVSDAMTEGCKSSARMCAGYVISAYQRIPDRIKVIIVGEELGY